MVINLWEVPSLRYTVTSLFIMSELNAVLKPIDMNKFVSSAICNFHVDLAEHSFFVIIHFPSHRGLNFPAVRTDSHTGSPNLNE